MTSSEILLGEWVRKRRLRKEVRTATKVSSGYRAGEVTAAQEGRLDRMGLDSGECAAGKAAACDEGGVAWGTDRRWEEESNGVGGGTACRGLAGSHRPTDGERLSCCRRLEIRRGVSPLRPVMKENGTEGALETYAGRHSRFFLRGNC